MSSAAATPPPPGRPAPALAARLAGHATWTMTANPAGAKCPTTTFAAWASDHDLGPTPGFGHLLSARMGPANGDLLRSLRLSNRP